VVTGEITFTNGEIAKSREAKKIKDSVLENRTEIKTNLITDELVSFEASENGVVKDSMTTVAENFKDSIFTSETENSILSKNSEEAHHSSFTPDNLMNSLSLSDENDSEDNIETITSDFHKVQKGETLYALSKRYGTTLGQLKSSNNLETTLIKEGQTLRVRNFENVESDSDVVWVVSKGDTLYNIAKRNNTTVDDIKDLNNLSSNLIKIGQKLQVNQNSTLSKK
jgi:LysM repeat protein